MSDDTYLIIPAENIHTRAEEIENVETWARNNNLTLNKSSTENQIVLSPIFVLLRKTAFKFSN